MTKKIIALLSAVILIFAFASCSKSDANDDTKEPESGENTFDIYSTIDGPKGSLSEPETKIAVKENPTATIKMEDGGKIVVELYYDKAPNTVENFIFLANSGFYDGLIFHRVIKNFMIQGGDPKGVGTGGPGYTIKGEFAYNGTANNLSHTRGTISMARSSGYDTAGSQFFICQADSTYLDGQYAAFGRVTSGMDVVDKIADAQKDANDKPIKDIVIKSITVDTHGIEFAEPVTKLSK